MSKGGARYNLVGSIDPTQIKKIKLSYVYLYKKFEDLYKLTTLKKKIKIRRDGVNMKIVLFVCLLSQSY